MQRKLVSVLKFPFPILFISFIFFVFILVLLLKIKVHIWEKVQIKKRKIYTSGSAQSPPQPSIRSNSTTSVHPQSPSSLIISALNIPCPQPSPQPSSLCSNLRPCHPHYSSNINQSALGNLHLPPTVPLPPRCSLNPPLSSVTPQPAHYFASISSPTRDLLLNREILPHFGFLLFEPQPQSTSIFFMHPTSARRPSSTSLTASHGTSAASQQHPPHHATATTHSRLLWIL